MAGQPPHEPTNATCGQCGYSVEGLTSFNCPECGADLRTVGIVSPNSRRPGSLLHLFWQIPLVTVCSAVFGLLMQSVIMAMTDGNQVRARMMGPPLTILIWVGCLCLLVWWHVRKRQATLLNPVTAHRVTHEPTGSASDTQPTSAVLTIMFVDMQDYSGQTTTQSRQGLAQLVQRLRDMVDEHTARYNGRLVKSLGDGFLLAFPSPTDALICGRALQQSARSVDLPALRVGISTGEVTLQADDVLGKPVNVAARIEQMTEPGHVYFGEATFHAMSEQEVPHEKVGTFELKGVAMPVTVFRVLT